VGGKLMPRSSSSGASSSSSEVALGSSSSIKYRILKDNRDGKEYKTVVIGTQTWMAENLNYNASGSKCGDGKLLSDNNTSFCDTYGRLYDWSTAMGFEASCNTSDCTNQINAKHQGVCLSGWHIPSNTEWDSLFRYVDGTSGTSSPYDSQIAGKYLKSTSGWNSNGTDDYGFSALPGSNGGITSFYIAGIGYSGYWWSASNYSGAGEHSYYFANLYSMGSYDGTSWAADTKRNLFSVRCVKD
jgi:uncharacterized protein (TIGR02145 family)